MKLVPVPFVLVSLALAACGSDDSLPDDSTTAGSGGANAAAANGGTPAVGGVPGTPAGNGGTTGAGRGGATNGGSSNGGSASRAGNGGAPGNAGASGNSNNGGSAASSSGRGGGGTGGASGTSGGPGKGGSGGSSGASSCTRWPASQGSQSVTSTIRVSAGSPFDGGMKRFTGSGALGGSGQSEDQPALFELANGATLRNVIIGAPAADGIHCNGTCTLQNVWWEDVGEDAATLEGTSSSQVMTIDCAGARGAADKVLQHNGPGTMIVRNFSVETFGKLYRSCGNCEDQYERHVQLVNVSARDGDSLVGLNENYGDTATFSNVSTASGITICERYRGNDTGAEPTRTGEGPDAEHCLYQPSSIGRL